MIQKAKDYLYDVLADALQGDRVFLSAQPATLEAVQATGGRNPHIETPSIVYWQSGINQLNLPMTGPVILGRHFVVSVRAETLTQASGILDNVLVRLKEGKRLQGILNMQDEFSEDFLLHEANAEFAIRE